MKLIINAEDFGMSESINKGICEGLKQGYISSATLFMNAKYTEQAIDLIKTNNFKNVGIHLNLTYLAPLSPKNKVKSLIEANGNFRYMCSMPFYAKYKDVKLELETQIKKFYNYGLTPTHLDFHHYFYSSSEVYDAYLELAQKYKLPVRSMNKQTSILAHEQGIKTPDLFIEAFHGGYQSNIETLQKIATAIKGNEGSAELMTTAGYMDKYTFTQTNYYGREQELNALKEAFEIDVWKGIKLIDFSKL